MSINEPHLVLVKGGNLIWYFDCICRMRGLWRLLGKGRTRFTCPLFMKRGYFIWQSEQLKFKEIFKSYCCMYYIAMLLVNSRVECWEWRTSTNSVVQIKRKQAQLDWLLEQKEQVIAVAGDDSYFLLIAYCEPGMMLGKQITIVPAFVLFSPVEEVSGTGIICLGRYWGGKTSAVLEGTFRSQGSIF